MKDTSVKEVKQEPIITAFESLAFAAYLLGKAEHRKFAAWWEENQKEDEVKSYLEEYSKKQNSSLLEENKQLRELLKAVVDELKSDDPKLSSYKKDILIKSEQFLAKQKQQ